jgi:hypothetical protein
MYFHGQAARIRNGVEMLDWLKQPELVDSIGVISSPGSLRRCLHKNEEVKLIRNAIAAGAITEDAIKAFSERLFDDFQKGAQFPHEVPLAAMCIAIEDRQTPFVEEFLLDLARLNIIEMQLAPAVARESLRHWIKLPRASGKTFSMSDVPLISERLSRSPQEVAQRIAVAKPGARFSGCTDAFA